MSWPCQAGWRDPKAITDLVAAVRGSSRHLGIAESSYLQPAARVATGRPEQSLDGGKEGGPSGRNKRWDREGRAEGLGSLAGGSYGALDI